MICTILYIRKMAISFFRGVPETTAAAAVAIIYCDSTTVVHFRSNSPPTFPIISCKHKRGNQISVFLSNIYFLFYFLRIYSYFPVAHQNMVRDTIYNIIYYIYHIYSHRGSGTTFSHNIIYTI